MLYLPYPAGPGTVSGEADQRAIFRAHSLVSLLDMERFYPDRLMSLIGDIRDSSHMVHYDTTVHRDKPVDQESMDSLRKELKEVRAECVSAGLSAATISNIDNCILVADHVPGTHGHLPAMLVMMESAIRAELSGRLFMYIPPEDAKRYDQPRAFGAQVASAFPSAAEDIREAGNCYATGRYTAAVYHAICALEPALIALSRSVRVRWRPNETTWAGALRPIEDRIRELSTAKGARRMAQRIAFLSQATTHFRYFKDAWRNDTMHARLKVAERADAERILNHAHSFMELLASRLHERGAGAKAAPVVQDQEGSS